MFYNLSEKAEEMTDTVGGCSINHEMVTGSTSLLGGM